MSAPPRHVAVVWLAALLLTSGAACGSGEDQASSGGGAGLATQGFPVQTVCGSGDVVIGIDVSQYQSTIDWDALAESGDVEFVYIRVGAGLGTDTQFYRNWPEARRVGLHRGAYQYFRSGMDALAEAQHYLEVIDEYGGYLPDDLPPMIDVEATDGESSATIVAAVRTWLDYVEAQTGLRPVIYTGSYFWDDNVGSDAFADYHLWTAHYTSATCPLMSSSWDHWTIWQYTSTGSVTGIIGNVDKDRFDGTRAELDLWPECSRFDPISDCLAPDWWCDPLDALVAAGVLDLSCADFRSDSRFSRAQWAELVAAALHLEDTDAWDLCRLGYSDVAAGAPYARAVATLSALDHGDGVTVFSATGADPRFGPADDVSRCEAAFIVAEAWDLPAAEDEPLAFGDAASLPAWCATAVRSAVRAGIVANGADPFRPDDPATVGEAALMLAAALTEVGRPTPEAADFADPSCAPAVECTETCTVGEATCDGSDRVTCELGPDDCPRWGQPQQCPAGQACDAGACVEDCDRCLLGEATCSGDAVLVCEIGAGGCADWVTAEVCGADSGTTCAGGACVAACDEPGGCDDVGPQPGGSLPRFAQTQGGVAGGCSVSPTSARGPGGLALALCALLAWRSLSPLSGRRRAARMRSRSRTLTD